MPEPNRSETLDALVKLLTLMNGMMPIVHGMLENEMATVGLSRQERYELRKKLTAETRGIADELQSNEP